MRYVVEHLDATRKLVRLPAHHDPEEDVAYVVAASGDTWFCEYCQSWTCVHASWFCWRCRSWSCVHVLAILDDL